MKSRITFLVRISTKIQTMLEENPIKHIMQVVETGRRGGGFFPGTMSGVPAMSREKTARYVKILKEARKKGYIFQEEE